MFVGRRTVNARVRNRLLHFEPLEERAMLTSVPFSDQFVIEESVANSPTSVFAADLDVDGDLDILSASADDGKIAWYENQLNEVTADFSSQRIITTRAGGAQAVMAADLDGDGDLDVVSASTHHDRIAWYENRLDEPTEDFGELRLISRIADNAVAVFASDLDGDGDQDVLSASSNDDKIAWYENRLNDPSGDFGPQRLISVDASSPRSVMATDLDGDGDADVLSASFGDRKIVWYENRLADSSADFAPQRVIATSSGRAEVVIAADLDGDGDQDVLSASHDEDEISWYENRSAGQGAEFGPPQLITTEAFRPRSLFAADLDGDGDQDLISASQSDSKVAWYENRLSELLGDFGPPQVITLNALHANSVFAADLDGDGDQDVLSASSLDDKVAWYENQLGETRGGFGAQNVLTSSPASPGSIRAVDLDNDGDSDVLYASRYRNTISWYENDSTMRGPQFQTNHVVTTASSFPVSVVAADLDADGDQDVVAASYSDGTIAWFENQLDEQSADFGVEQVISTDTHRPWTVFAADLDGDGDSDVLSASIRDDKIAWYENRLNEGAGNFGPQQFVNMPDPDDHWFNATNGDADDARGVFAADIDGDGDLDVLSASRQDHKVAWYENRLDEVTSDFGPQQVITTDALFATWVYAADLDGDADPDVLTRSFPYGKVAWYENRIDESTSDFGPRQLITSSPDSASWVIASDLDIDGDLDVITASRSAFDIAWHENHPDDATGRFQGLNVVTTSVRDAISIDSADLDLDGDLDLLSVSLQDDKIAWYRNELVGPLGDMNLDAAVDTGDVDDFLQALIDPEAYVADHRGLAPTARGDTDRDGELDLDDVEGFIDLLVRGVTAAEVTGSTTATSTHSLPHDARAGNGADPAPVVTQIPQSSSSRSETLVHGWVGGSSAERVVAAAHTTDSSSRQTPSKPTDVEMVNHHSATLMQPRSPRESSLSGSRYGSGAKTAGDGSGSPMHNPAEVTRAIGVRDEVLRTPVSPKTRP